MKAQISIEFVIMLGMAALTFMILLGIGYSIFFDKIGENKQEVIRDFGFSVQNELILASEVHEGYSREIFLADKIRGLEYTIYNTPERMFINVSNSETTFRIPNVAGIVTKGELTIENQGGQVVIS